MACHHKLTEPLETGPIPKDGELLSIREQRGSLCETVDIVELGQPYEQINIVLSLAPLGHRWQHHGVQGTQLCITRETRKDIGQWRPGGGPFTGQLVCTLQHCRWCDFFRRP